jgi:hypothetical protein
LELLVELSDHDTAREIVDTLTAEEIKTLQMKQSQWEQLLKVELATKNRSSVVKFINDKLHGAKHPAIVTFHEEMHRYPKRSQYKPIIEAIGHKPDDLSFWQRVVRAWNLTPWSPINIGGMLDCFKRREIPSTRSNANGKGQRRSGTLAQKDPSEPKLSTPSEEETLAFHRAFARKHAEQGVQDSPYYYALTDEERAELGIGV